MNIKIKGLSQIMLTVTLFLSRPRLLYISCTVCTCTVYSIVDVAHTDCCTSRVNWTGDIDRDLIWWYTPTIPGVLNMLYRFKPKVNNTVPSFLPINIQMTWQRFLSVPILTWGAIIAICCSNYHQNRTSMKYVHSPCPKTDKWGLSSQIHKLVLFKS